MATAPVLDSLKDLTRLIQSADGFHPLVAALKNTRSATIDGAWGSSAALASAAMGLHAPSTLLVVIGHPRDLESWQEDLAGFAGNWRRERRFMPQMDEAVRARKWAGWREAVDRTLTRV